MAANIVADVGWLVGWFGWSVWLVGCAEVLWRNG